MQIVEEELNKITNLPFDIVSEGEMTLFIHYPKLLEESEYGGSYVKPVIKVEAGVRSARVPTIKRSIITVNIKPMITVSKSLVSSFEDKEPPITRPTIRITTIAIILIKK